MSISDALAEAGLLSPPMREEWACLLDATVGGRTVYKGHGSEADARSWATDEGDQVVHRWVTDWEVVG